MRTSLHPLVILASLLHTVKCMPRIESRGVRHVERCSEDGVSSSELFTYSSVHRTCRQVVVVPKGQAVFLHFSHRILYCSSLAETEESAEVSTLSSSPLFNYCTGPASKALPAGVYEILLFKSSQPLTYSIKFIRTELGCDDRVSREMFGLSLRFTPTAPNCTIVLFPRSEVYVLSLMWKEHKQCELGVRIRMGKDFGHLYWTYPKICEGSHQTEVDPYRIGCGASVMNVSNNELESVSFRVDPIADIFDDVTAPLMCTLPSDSNEQFASR